MKRNECMKDFVVLVYYLIQGLWWAYIPWSGPTVSDSKNAAPGSVKCRWTCPLYTEHGKALAIEKTKLNLPVWLPSISLKCFSNPDLPLNSDLISGTSRSWGTNIVLNKLIQTNCSDMCNKNLWVRVWLSIQAKDWPVPAQGYHL